MPDRTIVALAALLLATVTPAAADAGACAAIATATSAQASAEVTITMAVEIAEARAQPAYCKVTGVAEPGARFEMRLPDRWNGNFYQAGCGGFCGDFDPEKTGYSNTIGEALKRGYAAITSNYGHDGGLADASWAVGNETALAVYADKGIPILRNAGHRIATAYYGKPPRRSYFAGCSNGGRQAAVAAQRYPDLFDGILAGAPVIALSQNGGLYGTWIVQKNSTREGTAVIGPSFNAKLPRLMAEIARQCTGPADLGIVRDPRKCAFNVEALPRCAAGQDTPACFTDAERATLTAWYAGPSDSGGRKLFSGTPVGSERFWPVWLTGTDKSRPVGMDLGRGFLKMAFVPSEPSPVTDPAVFDFDIDPSRLAPRAAALDAVDPELGAFAKSGGKMILYHGWADPVVLPQTTVSYYEAVTAHNGGLQAAQEFIRLFMIAGVGHCWELPAAAPDQFDPIAAIEAWVEDGRAPDAIPVTEYAKDGKAVRSGTLRPHPLAETINPPPGT